MGRGSFLPALLIVGVGATALIASSSPPAQPDGSAQALLRQKMGFSTAEVQALDAGHAVIRTLETPVRQEIAHVGAVYIDAPPERLLERFRDIERFERGPGVPQIGHFGSTPQVEDLASLTLPAADVKALAACRPGACDLQLPAAAIDRYRNEVRWTSPDAARQATQITREVLVALARAYQANGNGALGYYDDDESGPFPVAEHFRALLTSRDDFPAAVPGLMAYLDTYPYGRPEGAEEFLYWSVVAFGLKPTIRVNHVVIYPLPGAQPVAYAIAIKQLYASHYFHTTLELRFAIDDDRPGRGFWLVSLTRSRNDGMTGLKGLFLRSIISRRSGEAVRKYLAHVRQQVERPTLADGRVERSGS
ncbi:MAG: hypothetical protein A3H29_13085 [Acidobacteria bacterium RIFCSPLOWO2_02_FULL_67_21]|nr:MAG: hypothetical protein A3H29_13085 [Acidobacteria bacterium RIFCSPLOWO2_02_FULL_67_21]